MEYVWRWTNFLFLVGVLSYCVYHGPTPTSIILSSAVFSFFQLRLVLSAMNCVKSDRLDVRSLIWETKSLIKRSPHLQHQQQTKFPSGTPGCSWRPCQLWPDLVLSDRELNTTHHPSDRLCCIQPLWRLLYHVSYSCQGSCCILPCGCSPPHCYAFFALHRECVDVCAPSERHVC